MGTTSRIMLSHSFGDLSNYCCDQISHLDENFNGSYCAEFYRPEFRLPSEKAILGVAALKGLTLSDSIDYTQNSINTSQISEANHTSTTQPRAIPTSSDTSTHIPEKSESSCSSRKEKAIGAGVGVSLGVIPLASLTWALWLLRQNQNLKKGQAQAQGLGPSPGKNLTHGQLCSMTPSGGYMSPESLTHARNSQLMDQAGMPQSPSELPNKSV
ncbi:uncharacterized protein KD926_008857 [Aspergillus affinis]|uniref:uncharacterized protein n=1 Tax=Aspergillus affinis TaxID=1070780 RepID=UPI0022FF2F23|nr:uncharacterized protein KD926_008857 [Aspergillus affinis]KAI9045430.1 hypothetical protein KD926_008857 [Aspergillus affinis]